MLLFIFLATLALGVFRLMAPARTLNAWLLAVVFQSQSAAWAATYYVDRLRPGSDSNAGTSEQTPFLTISKCASKAINPGDTCLVKNGTYPEALLIRSSGIEGKPITFANFPKHSPIIRMPDGSSSNGVTFYAGKQKAIGWVVFKGFEVTRARSTGVKFNNAHNLLIQNNHVHDNGANGILGTTSRNVVIERNRVIDNGGCPAGVICDTGKGHGLYIGGQEMKILNNLITGSEGYGIQVAGYPYDCNQYAGGKACSSWDVVSEDYAFARNILIANNTIAGSRSSSGIVVWQPWSTNNTIRNNIFYNNQETAANKTVHGISFYNSGKGHKISNNLFYRSGTNASGIGDTKGGGSYTDLGGELFNTDPKFRSLAQSDYRLFSNSPALNKGVNLYSAGVLSDLSGNPRPSNGAFEIGAYEQTVENDSTTPGSPSEFEVE